MAEITRKKIFPTHIYDYNYKVSEGYYKPQAKYMDTRSLDRVRKGSPPKHKSYAERFAEDPWYGKAHGLPYKDGYSALNEPFVKLANRPNRASSLIREIRDFEETDVPIHIRMNRRKKRFEDEEDKLGIRSKDLGKYPAVHSQLPPKRDLRNIGQRLNELDVELARLAPRSVVDTEINLPSYKARYESNTFTSEKPPPMPRLQFSSAREDMNRSVPRSRDSFGFSTDSNSYRKQEDYEDSNSDRTYVPKLDRIRNGIRMKQSREICDDVQTIVDRMRSNKLNIEHGYLDRKDRGFRASSLDPSLSGTQKSHVSLTYRKGRR